LKGKEKIKKPSDIIVD